MEELPTAPTASSSAPTTRNRYRKNNPSDPILNTGSEGEPHPSGSGKGNPRGRGRGGRTRVPATGDAADPSAKPPSRGIGNPRSHRKSPKPPTTSENVSSEGIKPPSDGAPPSGQPRHRRDQKFNPNLTDASPKPPREQHKSHQSGKYHAPSQKDDLTSRLIHEIRTHPYPDCAICFNSIHPAQPTWSCSPTSSIAIDGQIALAADAETSQCCWITLHLKCVRSWASKSVKEVADALRARGEEAGESAWLCPACRTKRSSVPSGYK